MMDGFDAYHEWLGIPPDERPANCYQLLGIKEFESNTNAIQNAVDRRMAHVRTFQNGPNREMSQRILNELATAAATLLDPDRKLEYDRELGLTDTVADDSGPNLDGMVFGQYVLLDQIGDGGTGQVFKAKHRTLDRIVALKILSSHATQSPEVVARFRRKVQLMAKFQHSNLVGAYDAGEIDGNHYLVMSYVDGVDLAALWRRFNPLPIPHVVSYMTQAASALDYAHRHNVFHRNVKPSNLLIDRNGEVKVIGLGLARVVTTDDATLTVSGKAIGTVDYMAPEQIADASTVDQRADVYSLGCSLFAMVTGRPPFPGKSIADKMRAHQTAPIPSLRTRRPEASVALDGVCQRMLAKQPEQRYQSMAEVQAALSAIRDQLVESAQRPASPQADQALDQFLGWVERRRDS